MYRVWTMVTAFLVGAACVATIVGHADGPRHEDLMVGFGTPAALSMMGLAMARARFILGDHIDRSRRAGLLMPARVVSSTESPGRGRRRDYRLDMIAVPADGAPYRGTTTVRMTPWRAVALRPGAVARVTAARHDRTSLRLVPSRLNDSVDVDWADARARAVGPARPGPAERALRRAAFAMLADPSRWSLRIGHAVAFSAGALLVRFLSGGL